MMSIFVSSNPGRGWKLNSKKVIFVCVLNERVLGVGNDIKKKIVDNSSKDLHCMELLIEDVVDLDP